MSYTSSVALAAETVGDSDSGIPGWTLILTGVFGLGLGVVVAWLLFRRQSAGAAHEESRPGSKATEIRPPAGGPSDGAGPWPPRPRLRARRRP